MNENFVWVMKSVNKDMSSSHNPEFKYPESGIVEAKDWMELAIILMALGITFWFWGPIFTFILLIALCIGKYWDLKEKSQCATASQGVNYLVSRPFW